MSPQPRDRPRRPASLPPSAADAHPGGVDPAQRIEAAHLTAEALVQHGRDGDDARRARLVSLADENGLDEMAELWADRPANSLPGALYRLYLLRDGIRRDPVGIAAAFDLGRAHAPVQEAIAGVGDPPGPDEVLALADAVLAGAFGNDLGDALDRASAFSRVVATGWALLADELETDEDAATVSNGPNGPGTAPPDSTPNPNGPDDGPTHQRVVRQRLTPDSAALLTRQAAELQQIGIQLSQAASTWRDDGLH